ncbi:type II toxin-antitoxin system HicB family antitoxin [Pseudoduganella sp. UC29_106]|uniref:type II toxin-antitoxin system HicB family antitoxin n=1 Tax=Pseudoduganella sp. UC29_106 TaxID=3374553 RepID=UPI0037572729
MEIPVAIHKDAGSVYGVSVPDLPGCFSSGETIETAMKNVREAIRVHVEAALLESLPVDIEPSSIDELAQRQEYAGAIWALVEIDMAKLDPKPERINVSIPRFALSKIDQYAESRHESRSGFLTRAALSLIAKETTT